LAEVARLEVDNDMSARARDVQIVSRQEKTYSITIGTTLAEDRLCAPQIAIAPVMGLLCCLSRSTSSCTLWRRRKWTGVSESTNVRWLKKRASFFRLISD
jgi:hypothetical protein